MAALGNRSQCRATRGYFCVGPLCLSQRRIRRWPEGIAAADPFLGAWPANDLTGLALIGKIGETGSPFLVGPQVEFSAAETGTLYFMVNDDILDENRGALDVVVEFSTAAPATGAR